MHFVENLEAMYCSSLVQQKISENQRFIECSRKNKSSKPITEFIRRSWNYRECYRFLLDVMDITWTLFGDYVIAWKSTQFYRRLRYFTGTHGILQNSTGLLREGTVLHGRERYYTGENGFSRERTEENGISRERTGFHGEKGISRERTGFHGSERDFTERKGFHGRERDFTGENGISRRERDFTGENGISRE